MTDVIKNLNLDNPSEELKNETVHDAARDAVARMDAEDVAASAILTMAFALHQKLGPIAAELIKDFEGEKKVDDAVNDMTCAAACFVLGNAIVAVSSYGNLKRNAHDPVRAMIAMAKGQHMLDTATELGKLLGESMFNIVEGLQAGKFDKVGVSKDNARGIQSFIMSGKHRKK